MASICRVRALEDKQRRTEWLGWAEVWNELADDAIGHPFEEGIANRSSDLAKSNYVKAEWHAMEDDCCASRLCEM